MTISPLLERVGAQTPRLRSVPPYVSSAGPEAIELAEVAGLRLDPWQRLVLTDALGERADGKWAAFEVGLVCPRQNGKGSILEALELALLFLFADPGSPPPLVLHSAHEFKTSAEHFRRMRDLVDGSDLLRKQVRIVRTAAGSESIELTSGARLRFVTRTGGSGRGFSADTIVIDEAYNLTAESLAAVLPTMSARPNPQVWYTSSAGMAASDQLARVRERGTKGGDPSLAYFEWSADPDAVSDTDAIYQANPALGIRIPLSFVESERAALPPEQFDRERLGIWLAKEDARAVFGDRWLSLADPDAPRGQTLAFGVAVAPDRSWSAVAVAWHRPDGDRQVMLADYKPSTDWLPARVAELKARWGGAVTASTTARGLVPGATEPGQGEQALAHTAMDDAVTAGKVHHGNENALNTAVRGARWKPYGDTRMFDRKGSTDISPLDAAALALHGLTNAPASRPGRFMSL